MSSHHMEKAQPTNVTFVSVYSAEELLDRVLRHGPSPLILCRVMSAAAIIARVVNSNLFRFRASMLAPIGS